MRMMEQIAGRRTLWVVLVAVGTGYQNENPG